MSVFYILLTDEAFWKGQATVFGTPSLSLPQLYRYILLSPSSSHHPSPAIRLSHSGPPRCLEPSSPCPCPYQRQRRRCFKAKSMPIAKEKKGANKGGLMAEMCWESQRSPGEWGLLIKAEVRGRGEGCHGDGSRRWGKKPRGLGKRSPSRQASQVAHLLWTYVEVLLEEASHNL